MRQKRRSNAATRAVRDSFFQRRNVVDNNGLKDLGEWALSDVGFMNRRGQSSTEGEGQGGLVVVAGVPLRGR